MKSLTISLQVLTSFTTTTFQSHANPSKSSNKRSTNSIKQINTHPETGKKILFPPGFAPLLSQPLNDVSMTDAQSAGRSLFIRDFMDLYQKTGVTSDGKFRFAQGKRCKKTIDFNRMLKEVREIRMIQESDTDQQDNKASESEIDSSQQPKNKIIQSSINDYLQGPGPGSNANEKQTQSLVTISDPGSFKKKRRRRSKYQPPALSDEELIAEAQKMEEDLQKDQEHPVSANGGGINSKKIEIVENEKDGSVSVKVNPEMLKIKYDDYDPFYLPEKLGEEQVPVWSPALEFDYRKMKELKMREYQQMLYNPDAETNPDDNQMTDFLYQSAIAENSRRDFDLVRLSGYDYHVRKFMNAFCDGGKCIFKGDTEEKDEKVEKKKQIVKEMREKEMKKLKMYQDRQQQTESSQKRLSTSSNSDQESEEAQYEDDDDEDLDLRPDTDPTVRSMQINSFTDGEPLNLIATEQIHVPVESILEWEIRVGLNPDFQNLLSNNTNQNTLGYPIGGFAEPWTKDLWFEAQQWCYAPENEHLCVGFMQYVGNSGENCLNWCGRPQFCAEIEQDNTDSESNSTEFIEESSDWNLWYKPTASWAKYLKGVGLVGS